MWRLPLHTSLKFKFGPTFKGYAEWLLDCSFLWNSPLSAQCSQWNHADPHSGLLSIKNDFPATLYWVLGAYHPHEFQVFYVENIIDLLLSLSIETDVQVFSRHSSSGLCVAHIRLWQLQWLPPVWPVPAFLDFARADNRRATVGLGGKKYGHTFHFYYNYVPYPGCSGSLASRMSFSYFIELIKSKFSFYYYQALNLGRLVVSALGSGLDNRQLLG